MDKISLMPLRKVLVSLQRFHEFTTAQRY